MVTFPQGEHYSYTPGDCLPEYEELPFVGYVPKDYDANLRFRLNIRERASYDSQYQRDMIAACRADPLFWLQSFAWLYEPRPDDSNPQTVIPFITWPNQEQVFLLIQRYLGRRDIGIEKSRAQGASWIVLMLFLWEWIFSPRTLAFGLVSRNEDAVASPTDPDSLFWKLDFQLTRLPDWMIPWYDPKRDRNKSENSLVNPITHSTIVGAAATKAAFRSGRKTAILWDEFATFPQTHAEDAVRSTQHVSKCRIALSTYESDQDKFFQIMHTPTSMLKITMHWSHNPLHSAGLYKVDDRGRVVILDKEYEFPPDYEFVRRPKIGAYVRSPWYDGECSRLGVTPEAIAKELDINPGGASYKWFGELPQQLMQYTKPATHQGDVEYSDLAQVATWIPIQGGPFWLWCSLKGGYLPISQYVIGCDVAAGGGSDESSNSVLVIFDKNSGEQVGEYANHDIYPEQFAMMSAAVCRWIHEGGSPLPLLIWDAQGGTGSQFTKAILQSRYPRIYRRGGESVKKVHGKRITNLPGWITQDPAVAMGDLRAALISGSLRIRSKHLLSECTGWEWKEGKLVYTKAMLTHVESSKGKSHGDRVTAAAMAWQAMQEVTRHQPQIPAAKIPGPGWTEEKVLGHTGCMAYRLGLEDEDKAEGYFDLAPEEDLVA